MSAVAEPNLPVLRPMHVDDVGAVMDIERRVYPFPWTEGIFSDCVHVGYCCWVLERNNTIIGYSVMSIGADEAHILNLCVSPEQQGHGLGRQMLAHLIELARQHRTRAIYLEVRPTNANAIKLYRSMNFQEVGVRKDYYPAHKGREDALILEHKL